MSISTEIDLLIVNMIIFSRLYASFLIKGAKNDKNSKKCQLTEYIDIALSDLVFFSFARFNIFACPSVDGVIGKSCMFPSATKTVQSVTRPCITRTS